jgi:hypothetical protein
MSTNPETATDVHARPSFPMMRPEASVPPEEYAKLRKTCPVSKAKLFDGSDIWLITKHRDLVDALRDQRFSKVRTHPDFPELVEGAKAAVEGREPTFVDSEECPGVVGFNRQESCWFQCPHTQRPLQLRLLHQPPAALRVTAVHAPANGPPCLPFYHRSGPARLDPLPRHV